MNLQVRAFLLFLSILCEAYYRKTQGYQWCIVSDNIKGDIPCETFLGSSPVCLVCPVSREGQKGLSWKRANETLFVDTVRLRGDIDTFAVNECGRDYYTLSVSSTKLSNGGQYTCNLGITKLAQFNLIPKDPKPIKHERKLCVQDVNSKGVIPCEVLLGSSPTCLVCPIKSGGHTSLSWKYSEDVILYLGEVRIGKLFNTTVNQCGHENYSLSLSPTNVSDSGLYTCCLGETPLARFNVIVMTSIPQMYLGCKSKDGHCNTELQYKTTMEFECWVERPQTSFTLSWLVDHRTVLSSHYGALKESSVSSNFTSVFHHTFIGTERSLSCQVNGSHIVSTRETLELLPIQRVRPELVIFWKGAEIIDSVEINDNTADETRCVASNVNLPVTLSWEVDNQEKSSKEIGPWRKILDNNERYEINNRNSTNDAFYNLTPELYINLNFTPTDISHTIGCVCKGPLVFGRKVSVVLIFNQNVDEDKMKLYSPVIWIVVLLPVASLLVFCVLSMKKVVFPKKSAASSSSHSERFTETPHFQQDSRPEETYMEERTLDYDIYYATDNSESLSNFVRLINRISENGCLERWVGELSGMVYEKDYCVASTYNDDASEMDISEFRTLAMHVKDVVNHDNVVEIIGIEVTKEPFYIYTEYIEMGTLKDFLNDLQNKKVDPNNYLGELLRFSQEVSSALMYLKSVELSHPAICCEKVLLTEGGTCKIYDFQSYPVPEAVVCNIVLKHEQLSSNWKLAPETRLKKEHTFQSDSWSLSAFICEVYSMGTGPCKAARNSLYEVPANYYDVSFRRPHACPDSLYSILRSGWNIEKTERPSIETIYQYLKSIIT